MNRPNRLALALLATLLACPWCAAQVRVTFPLDGYYRPGKYMPVRVTSTAGTAGPVVLRAGGAVTVSVRPGPAGIDTVVPWLTADEVLLPSWQADNGSGTIDATLKPLEAGQVLVGIVGTDVRASTAEAAELFPGKAVVAVPLTGTPPIGGDPAAWEVMDAVVFDAPDNALLADLLGAGTIVLVRSEAVPGGDWPWRGGPGRWFVRFDPAGPAAPFDSDVYDAVAAWRPGWPAPARRRALLLAAVFCLVAVGITLWRRTRLAALAVVGVSAVAAVGFAWWGARQPMVCEVRTSVEVVGAAGTQIDHWTYLRPLPRREVILNWSPGSKPVYASARHVRETDLTLHIGPTGRPSRFTWRAEAGRTLAFLDRSFNPYANTLLPAATHPPLTPTRELGAIYLGPGDVILDDPGDFAPRDDLDWSIAWPPVTIRRK